MVFLSSAMAEVIAALLDLAFSGLKPLNLKSTLPFTLPSSMVWVLLKPIPEWGFHIPNPQSESWK